LSSYRDFNNAFFATGLRRFNVHRKAAFDRFVQILHQLRRFNKLRAVRLPIQLELPF
jgi:hypothetical protein